MLLTAPDRLSVRRFWFDKFVQHHGAALSGWCSCRNSYPSVWIHVSRLILGRELLHLGVLASWVWLPRAIATVGNGGYTYPKTVTCHKGRYTLSTSDLRVSNVLGRRPMIIAVENAEVDTREHCGLARSTPLQRGTPHTFALTSLSTPWHSSHAAFHDHSGLPAGTSPPIAPPRRALCWPRPHGRRRATMHIHRHR